MERAWDDLRPCNQKRAHSHSFNRHIKPISNWSNVRVNLSQNPFVIYFFGGRLSGSSYNTARENEVHISLCLAGLAGLRYPSFNRKSSRNKSNDDLTRFPHPRADAVARLYATIEAKTKNAAINMEDLLN